MGAAIAHAQRPAREVGLGGECALTAAAHAQRDLAAPPGARAEGRGPSEVNVLSPG